MENRIGFEGIRKGIQVDLIPVSLSRLLESSSVSRIEMSTLLRCCSLARLRLRPRLRPRLPAESTLPESFSSRLAFRVEREPRKPPPVVRFLVVALNSFDEVEVVEDEDMATAVADDPEDEEELNLAVELDEVVEPEDVALPPLWRVELLEVLVVLVVLLALA